MSAIRKNLAERGFDRRPDRSLVHEQAKDRRKSLSNVISFFRPEFARIFLLMAVAAFGVLCMVTAPVLQSKVIDALAGSAYEGVGTLLCLMLVLYICQSLALLVQGLTGAEISQRVVFSLRQRLVEKILHLPMAVIDASSRGDLISRMTNDTDSIAGVLSMSLAAIVSSTLTIAGTVLFMLLLSPELTALTLTISLFSLLITRLVLRSMRSCFTRRQALLGQLNGTVKDMVSNLRTIATYGREEHAIRTFTQTADELTRAGIKAEILGGAMGPIMNTCHNLAFVAIAFFGALLALKGQTSIGVISAFLVYAKQISRPMAEMAQLFGQMETALACAERIFQILELKDEECRGKKLTEKVRGAISFRQVSFGYRKDSQVLHNFSLEIKPAQKVALVGATGSGKTTVLNLLLRFYDADKGKILLDGVNIREIAPASLRSSIGCVLQETVLFPDTVRANLCYARPDISSSELMAAIESCECTGFIQKLPLGLETRLPERGGNLSQGQRQLLTIARTFIARPAILVLDEATSSVDTRTEEKIQRALSRLMQGRTSLIVAHRLSTVHDADLIVVMEQGVIVEQGKHTELMKKKGHYYSLYCSQFAAD